MFVSYRFLIYPRAPAHPCTRVPAAAGGSQRDREYHPFAVGGMGGDFALVGADDRLGDGQADAVPAGRGIAGRVRAVKALEKDREVALFDLVHGVFHGQNGVFAALFQGHADTAAVVRIL